MDEEELGEPVFYDDISMYQEEEDVQPNVQ